MKIAMVSEHASPLADLGEVDAGGQNLHVAELTAALERSGHEVSVYTRRARPDAPERDRRSPGYEVINVPAGPPTALSKDELLPHMGEFAEFLVKEWRRDPPDVVHAHFWMSGLASLLAARRLGLPVVQTFHALGAVKRRYQRDQDTSPPERLRFERMIGREASHIAASCSDELYELTRMGVPRSRISVVPSGVSLEQFSPEGPAFPRGDRTRIVSVGRLVPRKGFDEMITALRLCPDAELLIAGGPPCEQLHTDAEALRLREHARKEGVADRVQLLGQVSRPNMGPLLRSADIVACTPWYEPFGIVPLEAMACGVPVIAYSVGGLTDTVVDGVTGLLVPARQPEKLAHAVRRLTGSTTLREGYGMAAHDRVCSRYSWDRIAVDILRVYDQAGTQADRVQAAGDVVGGGQR